VFAREWGIDFKNHPRGGVTGVVPQVAASRPRGDLMQRKTDALGKTLGRTTGWTHRMVLNRRGVQMVGGVEYLKHRRRRPAHPVNGEPRLFEVDTVIVCAGQTPLRTLYDELQGGGNRPRWWAAPSRRPNWTPSAPSTRPAAGGGPGASVPAQGHRPVWLQSGATRCHRRRDQQQAS
jgi:hypothetical protein